MTTTALLTDLDRLQAGVTGFISAAIFDVTNGLIVESRCLPDHDDDSRLAEAMRLALQSRALLQIEGLEEVVATLVGELQVLFALDADHVLVLTVDRFRTNPSLLRATLHGWRASR